MSGITVHRFIVALCLALFPGARVAAAQSDAGHVEGFRLRDQFRVEHAVRFADAPLTLVIFSGRDTHREGTRWLRDVAPDLRAREPGLRVVEVAAVGSPSRLMRPIVVRVFRRRVKGILLDWDDAVAERFGYEQGAARAVLVDSTGHVRAAASGAPTARDGATFVQAVAVRHAAARP